MPLTPAKRTRLPGWAVAVASAVAVLVIAIPLWMMTNTQRVQVAGTIPAPSAVQPPVPTAAGTIPVPSTVLSPQPPQPPLPTGSNPHIGIDQPFGNLSGHEQAPSWDVMLRVNGGESRLIARTDLTGSYGVNGVVDVGPGDTIEVTIGLITKTIRVPLLTIDIFDIETGFAAGRTDLPDGTVLSLAVFPDADPEWTPFDVVVNDGQWSFDIPLPLTPEGGADIIHFDDDGDVITTTLIR